MRSNFLGWKSYLVFDSFYNVTEKSKLLLYTGCPDGFAFFDDVIEKMTNQFLNFFTLFNIREPKRTQNK